MSLCLLIHCKAEKAFFPDDSASVYIKIGNGGGFTGKTTAYFLLDDGRVFLLNELGGNLSMVGKLPRDLISQQWEIYRNQGLANIIINDPGNFYYFLEFKHGSKNHQMVWQDLTAEHKTIQTVFMNLMSSIRKINS